MKKLLPNGFTLIELLVVIAIIAILSAIGFVSYSSFLKNARDVKRQSDLKFIQSALEEYYADQKYYPEVASGSCTADGKFRAGCPLTYPTGPSTFKTYLNQIPNGDYNYQPFIFKNNDNIGCNNNNNSTELCTDYCLFTKMEKIPRKSENDVLCSVNADINLIYNYAVTKP